MTFWWKKWVSALDTMQMPYVLVISCDLSLFLTIFWEGFDPDIERDWLWSNLRRFHAYLPFYMHLNQVLSRFKRVWAYIHDSTARIGCPKCFENDPDLANQRINCINKAGMRHLSHVAVHTSFIYLLLTIKNLYEPSLVLTSRVIVPFYSSSVKIGTFQSRKYVLTSSAIGYEASHEDSTHTYPLVWIRTRFSLGSSGFGWIFMILQPDSGARVVSKMIQIWLIKGWTV